TASPACQSPTWEQPNVTPHALWVFGTNGADQPGATNEDMYFGAQDNGTFATQDFGNALPAWANRDCCDSFSMAANSARVLYSMCCFAGATRFFLRNPG